MKKDRSLGEHSQPYSTYKDESSIWLLIELFTIINWSDRELMWMISTRTICITYQHMTQTLFHITLWRSAIAEFSKEIGYSQHTRGLVNNRISIQLKSERTRLVATVHLDHNSLNYEIASTHDCVDFCQLLKAIESVKSY